MRHTVVFSNAVASWVQMRSLIFDNRIVTTRIDGIGIDAEGNITVSHLAGMAVMKQRKETIDADTKNLEARTNLKELEAKVKANKKYEETQTRLHQLELEIAIREATEKAKKEAEEEAKNGLAESNTEKKLDILISEHRETKRGVETLRKIATTPMPKALGRRTSFFFGS